MHPQTQSRHHPDTLRHHSDTPDIGVFYTIHDTGRKGKIWVSWPNINFCQQIWHWCILRHSQTQSRHHPDTLRHHPDTPDIGVFYTIHDTVRKGKIWVSWPDINFCQQIWYWCILRHPQTQSTHHPDTLRHHPDTPDIGAFMQNQELGERVISGNYELIENLPMDLVLVRPKISSFHIPDTIQTCLDGVWNVEWGDLRMYQYQIHWQIFN